ncbi:MAG: hydroxyethylthiazole kinase [Candidatus Methanomethylophilaceae archaeon]
MTTSIAKMMTKVRNTRPLVHHITNYVTVNDCANITICAGGAPVMSDAAKDVPEMVRLASALVLNIGTLRPRTVDSMIIAGKEANDAGVPVILDPVGVGATTYRTESARRILNTIDVSVIKGNAGEIGVLAGTGGDVRGVDSMSKPENCEDTVKTFAGDTSTIVAMTGPIDYVSDGKKVLVLKNGHDYLECVSGTGCMVSSVTGCYVGVHGAKIRAVSAAISVFSIAGEMAAANAKGPGSFKTELFDSMYNLTEDDVTSRLKME